MQLGFVPTAVGAFRPTHPPPVPTP